MKLLTALFLTMILLSSCGETGRVVVTHAHTVTDKGVLNDLQIVLVDDLFNLHVSQDVYESLSVGDRCMFTYVKESMLELEYATDVNCDIPVGGFSNPNGFNNLQ